MKKSNNNIANIFTNRQCKDKDFKIQLALVYNAFRDKPMTMLEADYYTGIMRSNICWHIDNLLVQGRIFLIRKRKCSITGFESKEFKFKPIRRPDEVATYMIFENGTVRLSKPVKFLENVK